MATSRCNEKKGNGRLAVGVLLFISSAITVLGVAFGVYALLHGVQFSVMGAQIPGAIFAAVAVFLGVRYCLAALRLSNKISGTHFSWKNFKPQRAEKKA